MEAKIQAWNIKINKDLKCKLSRSSEALGFEIVYPGDTIRLEIDNDYASPICEIQAKPVLRVADIEVLNYNIDDSDREYVTLRNNNNLDVIFISDNYIRETLHSDLLNNAVYLGEGILESI